ncbi:CAP domain-containing protein [Arsenicitalea aurantiaca]|nr:CAP domain-containing protein [Arsenicitalea aurantiaca]
MTLPDPAAPIVPAATSLSRRTVLMLGGAALLAACSPTMPRIETRTPPGQLSVATMTQTINAVRRANGAPALAYNAQLASAARFQAERMASRDTLSHDLGTTLRQRVTEAGYLGAVGENVAAGHKTLEHAIEGWLNSPSHRFTLLSPNFVEFGLATANTAEGTRSRYGTFWALVMGGSFDAWRA